MMRARLYFRASAIAAAFVASTICNGDARQWTLLDAIKLSFINDVQLAPDGRQALIEIDWTDWHGNAFNTAYRSVAVETGATAPLPLTVLLSHPRWSPDSASVAWLKPTKSGAELVITDPRGKIRRAVTSAGRDVLAFSWSPDGRTIAAIETPASAIPAGRLFWLNLESDYRGTRPPPRDVWLVDVSTGLQHRLTDDGWSYGGPETDHDPSWSLDGSKVAVVRQPTPLYGDFEHAQYVDVDVHTKAVVQVVRHSFFAYPASAAPVFGPNGAIAYAHTWDGQLASREDVFVDGRDISATLDRDLWSCSAGTIAWQSGMLLASLMDGVAIRLFELDPNGTAAPKALTPDDGSVVAFSIARNGTIAYVWTTSQAVPELYVRTPAGSTRRVTHVLDVPQGLAIATTRTFTWNHDGRGLHGLLTLPAARSLSGVPLIVEPHGGPQCADPSGFSGIAQYFASNGYAYFRPDPPGSDGYGDWSYKAIVGNWGELPMSADVAGVNALYGTGVGDPKRTFIEGGSYGGYLTSWIVTHTDRFCAAVAEVPVTDLELDYALSESPNITRRFFGANPTTNPQLLALQSPLHYVTQERTPLLLVAGLRDTRAPYVQAIEFYKALAENGAPVRMLADPDAGHGPNDPQGWTAWWSVTAAWFAQHGGIAIPDAHLP